MGEQDYQRIYAKLDNLAEMLSDMRVKAASSEAKLEELSKIENRVGYLEKRDEVFAWKVIGSILTAVAAVAMTILQFFLAKMGK